MKTSTTGLKLWTIGTALVLAACAGERVTDPLGTNSDTTTTSSDSAAARPDTNTNQGTGGGSTPHAGYYVSANGTSGGDGSEAKPWDMATAFAGASGKIHAGDTVWIRGGNYKGVFQSHVSGAVGNPVVYRQYPGERATLDGRLRLDGSDVVVWGFEIMRTSQGTTEYPNLESRGPRQKLINMVIHESEHQGIRFWDEAVDAEMYGCIVYNNGTHENLDHGTYVHNVAGTKLIMDNVFFNNLAYGIHVYVSPGEGAQKNIHVIGNVAFNNGTISTRYAAKGNILIGGEQPGEGHQAIDNMTYFSGTAGVNMRLGFVSENKDVVATGNTIWGGATAFQIGKWSSAQVKNNTIGGSADMVNLNDTPDGYVWSGNKYYRAASASAWRTVAGTALPLDNWKQTTGLGSSDAVVATTPSATKVFVRANKYEHGRAMIVVYNWGKDGSATADLSGVLRSGQRYEVRNVQDFFGAPVVSGTYSGGTITVPMTGVNPPARIGRSTPTPPRTGPDFDTFIVIPVD